MSEYRVRFYKNSRTGKEPVYDYLMNCNFKDSAKIEKYIEYLRISKGYLDEPLSRHIKGKIRELRVNFARNRHRILYFTFIGKRIIFLHAFLKKSKRMPRREIKKATERYFDAINNPYLYD